MIIETKYNIGQIVYVRCDFEQRDHYIIEIIISLNEIKYKLRGPYSENEYYEFEITGEKNILKALTE